MRSILLAGMLLATLPAATFAQLMPIPEHAAAGRETFDTSYRASAMASARIQRSFLDSIRWSIGAEVRDNIRTVFGEKPPLETWQELVAADGLALGNVADALTAYWVLNWITANARYTIEIDNEPIRRQLAAAMEADTNFRRFDDLQKQDMAEGYILKFLVEHTALQDALAKNDIRALSRLALASATRFRQQMGVNLLALEPGPEGLVPKAAGGQ
ncbi:hypothetical protein SAMN05216456_2228 [Devosia crocina]|uniref:DUF4142 domain-containing protein n=1 Tax=Devosia crocina TaxID=429728 RepID=A0A1I7NMC4_9HYPH|nr:DUF6683 family protein [Devosia crocina]SFV35765.1 hypothetical protein SAMN05216456_2228 [Devosia crocina]